MVRRRRSGRSIHQIIRNTVLGCVLLCALVSLWALEMLSTAYDGELAARQGYVQDQCFARVEECLKSAEWLSVQFIASDPIQQALKTISQSEGRTLAGARTLLNSAISFTAYNAPSYMRNIMLMDMQGNRYSYGNILNKMQLLEEIGELMLRTQNDGSIAWYGLIGNGTEYMVLTRAIRESHQLSLELIGYEAICIDVRMMLSKIEVVFFNMLDKTEIYMDGLRLYRGDLPRGRGDCADKEQAACFTGRTQLSGDPAELPRWEDGADRLYELRSDHGGCVQKPGGEPADGGHAARTDERLCLARDRQHLQPDGPVDGCREPS